MKRKKIDKLNKNQLEALSLYIQLEASKFGKTKKAKYQEISKRMKVSPHTIAAWIYRYEKGYREYIAEIVKKKNAKKCTFKGLTEKQTIYVKARMEGNGTEKAKEMAGYSEKTKPSDIEKSKKVSRTIGQLREELIEDTKLGVQAQLNDLRDIKERARNGVMETQYTEESTPEGRKMKKIVKTRKLPDVEISAIREINNILGYNYADEMKYKKGNRGEERITTLSEDD